MSWNSCLPLVSVASYPRGEFDACIQMFIPSKMPDKVPSNEVLLLNIISNKQNLQVAMNDL